MLKFDAVRIFALRGISNPYRFLIENGFTETTAIRISHNRITSLNLKFVEKLCVLFKCTPNDLLVWVPKQEETLADDQPMKTLRRVENYSKFSRMRSNLPLQELEKLMGKITEPDTKTT